jgi:hypothetical protein
VSAISSAVGVTVGVQAIFLSNELAPEIRKTPVSRGKSLVGDTGFEPVTSSVSGKRATAAPIARAYSIVWCEVGTGFEPV